MWARCRAGQAARASLSAAIESIAWISEARRVREFGDSWPAIWSVRNRIAHGYIHVDDRIIHATVNEDLPEFEGVLERRYAPSVPLPTMAVRPDDRYGPVAGSMPKMPKEPYAAKAAAGREWGPGCRRCHHRGPRTAVLTALARERPTDTNPLAPCLRTMFEVRPPGVSLPQAVSAQGDHLHRGARPVLS